MSSYQYRSECKWVHSLYQTASVSARRSRRSRKITLCNIYFVMQRLSLSKKRVKNFCSSSSQTSFLCLKKLIYRRESRYWNALVSRFLTYPSMCNRICSFSKAISLWQYFSSSLLYRFVWNSQSIVIDFRTQGFLRGCRWKKATSWWKFAWDFSNTLIQRKFSSWRCPVYDLRVHRRIMEKYSISLATILRCGMNSKPSLLLQLQTSLSSRCSLQYLKTIKTMNQTNQWTKSNPPIPATMSSAPPTKIEVALATTLVRLTARSRRRLENLQTSLKWESRNLSLSIHRCCFKK